MLKIIKKSRLLVLIMPIIAVMLTASYCVYADGGWECTTLPEGSSQVTAYEDSIKMYFKTEGNEGKANAEKIFDFSANEQICISFNTTFTGTDNGIVRRLNLQNSSLITTELINITGTSLKVFGTAADTLSENQEYTFDIGVIPETGFAVVWLNGEKIYSGELGSKWKKFNYSSMRVLFRNTSSSKTSTLESEWSITDFRTGDKNAGFKVNPADGEVFVDSSLENITMAFDGINSPEMFTSDNFMLTANGETIECSAERDGNKAVITPKNGFLPDTEYVVTVKAVKDIFGNVVEENKSSSFTTADSSYVPSSVVLSADKTSFYDNESTFITVKAQSSSGIASTKIYVNNAVYQEYDGEPKDFDFTAESGRYKIYAEITDNMGGKAVSQTVTLDILHNDLPVIDVNGIANLGEYEAEKLKNITVAVSDADGNVVQSEIYINGELYDSFADAEKTLDLSSLSAGIYTVKFIAEDNLGGITEKEITITVLEGYTASRYFFSDFNSYTSDGTTSPGIPFFLNGDAQLLASKDYGEEHGTVVLFRTDGKEVDGVNANGSWGRLGTTNTRDGFTITMDINLVNDKGQFYFMMKHPTQSVLCMDVLITEGQLTLANGGSIAVRQNLTPGEWYTITYKVDIKNHKYWFSLNGEPLADEFNMGNRSIEQIDARLIMEFPNKEPVSCGIAFDNLTVDYISPISQITAIGYDDTPKCSKVSPYAENLIVTVNTALQENTMNRESVLLYCGDERVNYESLAYDSSARTITLKLSEKLRSDHDYRVVLTNKVTTADGGIMPNGITGEFKTDYNNIDIKQLDIVKGNGQIYNRGTIYNRTGKSDECYIITNIFKGKRLVDTYTERTAVSSRSETVFSTSPVSIDSGCRAEVYVWSSLVRPSSISSRIYSLD